MMKNKVVLHGAGVYPFTGAIVRVALHVLAPVLLMPRVFVYVVRIVSVPSFSQWIFSEERQPMTPVRAMSEPSSPKSFVDMPSPVTVPSSLSPEVTSKEVTAWLKHNRFSQYINVFQNFAGADLLRLTRDDLIQICGLADGIRLNNALQSRNVRPRLSLYVCQEPGTVYHALYLESLTSHELVAKITDMFKLNSFNVSETYVQGPSAIHILLTDEVVRNISDQSRMWLEIKYDDSNPDQIKFLLKLID